ncbi:BPTD_3080 family restriction endonuclease [Lentisalinibacter sediminis]|uniref:BPTD_3080 family restriction endonuclease n=1 Tax=Lentisalinibacter sediminis TaxID=2992237 RepID=UPI00386BFC62
MEKGSIDRLIINSPYDEPSEHWKYHRETRSFSRETGRRPAGYVVASESSKAFDDPGQFVEIPLVNQIRPRVSSWRAQGYPGVSGITKRLLEYWTDPETFELRRFFFCQLEAIETLIWLTEASPADRVGIDIPSDGGDFMRLCAKMATGSGKTIVMAMLIAWQAINKATYPQDGRFSRTVLVVAPGLTVKNRLAVLDPDASNNYYESFRIVPSALLPKLRQADVLVHNWHALSWETEEKIKKKRSVDKRGPKSDEAYVRDVMGNLSGRQNILIINDEAHHAWRLVDSSRPKGLAKSDIDEATKWVGGLDRIHRSRGILTCYDFSATPFTPSGNKTNAESLFGWIVSDFGLNDAIESGLVKTPRVVIRDDAVPDAKTYRSKLYHIYNDPEVKDDLSRKARPSDPLPDLVINAYYLLGFDWRETAKDWASAGLKTPPVMITVANRTETAARVKYAFDTNRVRIEELATSEKTLHIDTKVLEQAESTVEPIATPDVDEHDGPDPSDFGLTKKEQAELLRQTVDTVGQVGKPGEKIQAVISVGMLTEGWDAKTVTHIMGLRAFSSQLLCEQVVGRGLRRTAYELTEHVDPKTGQVKHLFDPEYVNIFGVPFTFLPHETQEGVIPPPPRPKTIIEPVTEKLEHEIKWPNIIRVESLYRPRLELDWKKVKALELNASDTAKLAELAPMLAGKPDISKASQIDLEKLAREFRPQRIIFETARDIYDQMNPNWAGEKTHLLVQLIRLVEQFISSRKVQLVPSSLQNEPASRQLIITLNMAKVVQHIWEAIRFQNAEQRVPVFDEDQPIRSTADMRPWYTGKPCEYTLRSHINFCTYDSTWEASEAYELDRNPVVHSWVKNDRLGFEIFYIYRGIVKKYRPDFIVRLRNGRTLVLETKGQDSGIARTKREFLEEWICTVNEYGGFGKWSHDISFDPGDIKDILVRHSR